MDAVEEIKTRLDVADVVQEYLPLKPAGSGSFRGLCPFHHEKTPSFYVNRPRQSWHCFGCNEGGDIISFVMRMEGMEFREALELLATKAGVELPTFDVKKQSDKKRLYEVNMMAAKYFRAMLLESPNAEHARTYAASRGIDDLTGDLWLIGYAPDGWSNLTEALTKKGATEDELIRAGLIGKREQGSGTYDRFRNRLMFTIADVHGNIVGFTGRLLSDEQKEAKYVNTPETQIYKKSSVLYGLDKAKGDIKREDLAVIAEGNMDVVTSHRVGVANVVASSGTALTGEQLNLIKRFTTNLAIAFDQDAAGNAATIRGLDLARQLDFNIHVITLPPEAGKDPDDVAKKDVNLWRDAIRDAKGIVDWLYVNAFRGRDVQKPEDKKLIARDLLVEFRRIPDPVERDGWVTRLARDLAVSEDALREAMKGMKPSPPNTVTTDAKHAEPVQKKAVEAESRQIQLQDRLLAIIQLKPELRALAQERLARYPLAEPEREDLSNYLAILADREFEDQSLDTLTKDLEKTATDLHELLLKQECERLEQEMRDAERLGDTARINALAAQFTQLNS
ncbi:MAG: DNA primase [Patescibacteria group bacterium]|jgi:DNA primase